MIDLLVGFATSAIGVGATGGVGAAAIAASWFLKNGATLVKWGGRVLIVLGAFLYGYHLADDRAEHQRERDRLQLQVNNLTRDVNVAKATAQIAAAERDSLKAQAQKLNDEVANYEEELRNRPAVAACTIDDADLRFLKRLRDQPGAKPVR